MATSLAVPFSPVPVLSPVGLSSIQSVSRLREAAERASPSRSFFHGGDHDLAAGRVGECSSQDVAHCGLVFSQIRFMRHFMLVLISKGGRPIRKLFLLRVLARVGVLGLGLMPLQATPDRSVTVQERFLGTNADDYAILRTEVDNMGSYYREHRWVWLDEYPKEGGSAAEPRSTLLLDQNFSADPDNAKAGSTTENSRNDKPSLADLVQRYPAMDLIPWSAEQVAEVQFDAESGEASYKSQRLVEAGGLLKKRFRISNPEVNLALIAVAENSNNLFLTISSGDDEGREMRVIAVPSKATRNARALGKLEAVYLSAGTFESSKDALVHARELSQTKKPLYSGLVVWSVFHADTGKTDYSVVSSISQNLIHDNEFAGSRNESGTRLTPITSEGFRELIEEEPVR